MKCLTQEGGLVTLGIKLWRDEPVDPGGKPKYTVHCQPDYWLAVRDDVIDSDCVRREGDDVILMRCSIEGGQVVPEAAQDVGNGHALVLGVLDKRQVVFSNEVPEPPHYLTVLGPNSCCAALYFSRIVNRGTPGRDEEFRFLAGMREGDHMDTNVIFHNAEGSSRHDLWASGAMLTYEGGVLTAHQLPVIPASQRFMRR